MTPLRPRPRRRPCVPQSMLPLALALTAAAAPPRPGPGRLQPVSAAAGAAAAAFVDDSNYDDRLPALWIELSDMLPRHAGACPDLPGLPAEVFRNPSEVQPCSNLLRKAERDGTCLVYSFAWELDDPFVAALGRHFPGCEVYVFDASSAHEASRAQYLKALGASVRVVPHGLGRRRGPLQPGDLASLLALQGALGHAGRRLSLLRLDCGGCEYEWAEEPGRLAHVDQLFLRLHVASPPGGGDEPKVPALHAALTGHFRVVSAMASLGAGERSIEVESSLARRWRRAGVAAGACCRELSLVNEALAAAAAPAADDGGGGDQDGAADARRGPALLRRAAGEGDAHVAVARAPPKSPATAQMLLGPELHGRFRGALGTCPGGEEKTARFGPIQYCTSLLRAAARSKAGCRVYHFGAKSPHEVDSLRFLGHGFPRCRVLALDPEMEQPLGAEGSAWVRHFFGANVRFLPWGLLLRAGGARARRTERPGAASGDILGELYRLDEIHRAASLPAGADAAAAGVTLLRADFGAAGGAARSAWRDQLLSVSRYWAGAAAVEQLSP